MGWTAEQLNAITEKNGNILVSAAAGSGKTAVLVERIIRLITDKDAPVDIDRLLVVTFTRAAASEMKERIGKAIGEAIRNDPESINLRRQAVLINRADIMTIHSFCMKVARDNYNRLGIDPAFRVADETETLLLKDEVLDRLFEEKYASDEPEGFLYMVENYSDGTSDGKLKELVLKTYEFIRSCPDPDEWIRQKKEDYSGDCGIWFDILTRQLRGYVRGALEVTNMALETAYESGPETYIPMLESDRERLKKILESANEGFDSFYTHLSGMRFEALSRKKCESETKEKVKFLRDRAKKIFASIEARFPLRSPDEMKADIKRAGYGLCLLLDLVKEFSQAFDEEKKRRRIADYGDLEHYCLDILMGEGCTSDNPVKSEEARELSEKYAYVMTDEYQDSNAVQELILNLVSKGNNRFMVGDVKQSIYSFRLADPDIFTEKYNTFSLEKGAENERIDMFKNFRSREEVLEGINFIFTQLMSRDFGGIDYDDRARLYCGAEFPMYTGEARCGGAVEVDVINSGKKEPEEDDDAEELAGIEKEMNFVADRINSLMYGGERMEVYDASIGGYRELRYSDIVIIMRKKTYGAAFAEILGERGIPASAESGTGFLETAEVMTVLSFLRIIDNPRQDVPLAAVLRSPVYQLSADDLLSIKLESGDEEYWDCVLNYEERGTDERIKNILNGFISSLNKWRDMAVEERINDLIWTVYTDTGYYDLVGVLPEGKTRQTNLLKLVKKASDYDSISFKGLFDFIRYIEKINKNDLEIDSGAGTGTGGVRIMTIHKSKGLEFPVVFLSGCGLKFNKTDINANVIIHKNLGIGSEYTDEETRVKYNTIPRAVIAEAMREDSAAEEVRILYVAMTRAKEKLIITGHVSESRARRAKWTMFSKRREVTLPPFETAACNDSLDWILMALSRHRDGKEICALNGETPRNMGNGLYDHRSVFELNFINYMPSEIPKRENDVFEVRTDEDKAFLRNQIAARLSWKYPYEIETGIPGTVSVSEVKRIRGTRLSHTVRKPDFYSGEKGLTAEERGSAAHKVLEHMDFSKNYGYNDIKALVEGLKGNGILSDDEAASISVKRIKMFAESDLYKRILNADKIYKEEAFTVAVSPGEIYKQEKYMDMDEAVILHGRIDCYFVEQGEIVLLDYKTDHYDEDSEEKFHERYDIQMELYSKAIEKVTGMKVKECYIYSVASGKSIRTDSRKHK